ncbi:hypothetical protein BC936DRAFT_145761 [Jimgerdemannia flammicorona]|uniref:Uncharacterized protein n=2 Tax=Jimgerdemannia flammicorona TaxID=994334 RepID=A0A433D9W0_9FUNG|nr:hypothetical protein BC936DRAFT_145761 [Jimgerdemannia flammicorona]RUS31013.1 hypothetical protein BC938DRAFT_478617 [Jimgerdemannia flammicorona]
MVSSLVRFKNSRSTRGSSHGLRGDLLKLALTISEDGAEGLLGRKSAVGFGAGGLWVGVGSPGKRRRRIQAELGDDLVDGAVLGAAEPDIVRNFDEPGDDEVVAGVDSFEGAKSVLQVVAAAGSEVDVVKVEPSRPEEAREPAALSINVTRELLSGGGGTAGDIEVDDTENAFGEGVGHGHQTDLAIRSGEAGELELGGVVANDDHVVPPTLLEALTGNLAERAAEINQVDLFKFLDGEVVIHTLNVPA